MSIALVALSDGRPGVEDALRSLSMLRSCNVSESWIHDDSGDDVVRRSLEDSWSWWRQIGSGPRRGFTGTMRHVRRTLLEQSSAEWFFWFEADFTLLRLVDLDEMRRVLDGNPRVVQMALRRQPWSTAEVNAGGVVEQWPGAYRDEGDVNASWLTHRLFWTCNPSLFPRRMLEIPWPDCPGSEAEFGRALFRDPLVLSAYWGSRDSGVWCHHSGTRSGIGY